MTTKLLLAALLAATSLPLIPAASSAMPAVRAAAADAGIVLARNGADDGAGYHAGDDRGRGRGRGADDGVKHDAGDDKGGLSARRGRGADDGVNHDAGDDRGGGRGGRGRDD